MKLHLWNTALIFFHECSYYIGKYPQTVFFFLSFLCLRLKHPFSAPLNPACVWKVTQNKTKKKLLHVQTELGLHDGIFSEHDIQWEWELRSALNNLSLCLPWPAVFPSVRSLQSKLQWELSMAGLVPLVFLIICFLGPPGGQMQSFDWLLRATISLHWRESCFSFFFFFCLCTKSTPIADDEES